MATCLIGVGSNLGDRSAAVAFAAGRLGEQDGVGSLRISREITTRPVGGPAGGAEFLNAAFRMETSLAPRALLQLLLDTERAAGREKAERWGARRLDLDLLLYDEAIIDQEDLVVPHPRMAFRRFVLQPAAEIAGEMKHPTTGRTVAELLERLATLPHYIAISDAASAERQSLLSDVAAQTKALPILTPEDVESQAGDSAGRDAASAIEFLDQRTQAVACVSATSEPRVWISDFWLGDVLLAARRSLVAEALDEFEQAWRDRESRMPEPVVVIVFDAKEVVLRALRQAGVPALRLNSAESDWNRQELGAAVEALK